MVSLLLMNAYHGNRQNNYYQLWQHSFNFNYCTYIAFKGENEITWFKTLN